MRVRTPGCGFQPILTAAETRAAEDRAIAGGTSARELMERAGRLAADAVLAVGGRREVLVLAGSGNNGGDGYVLARTLKERGTPVRVAASAPPGRSPAREAYEAWGGKVEAPAEAAPAPIFVDALLGIGLSRPLGGETLAPLARLAAGAAFRSALDVPSGLAADSGACLSDMPAFDLTVAFGTLKPGHVLMPGRARCGRLVVADIGLDAEDAAIWRNAAPEPRQADPAAHKFERGAVVVAAGRMPGAALLAARAAQHGGAGYVTVAADEHRFPPSSLVVLPKDGVDRKRAGALVVGPGLGRDAQARHIADWALNLGAPLVIDGDMFSLFAGDPSPLAGRDDVMTPHEGEFARLFGDLGGDKIARARAAAARIGNVIVLKGADTVIAAPDGRAVVNDHAHPRLAMQGSGDVLAGLIAAEIAGGRDAFAAACAGVWRQGDAGLRAADGATAEDLIDLL